MKTVDVDKISSASDRIYTITKQLSKNYDDIDYSRERIERIIETLRSYDGSYADSKYIKNELSEMVLLRSTWIVSVKSKRSVFDKKNKANIALLKKEKLNLDRIANDLALAIKRVENKLGVDATKRLLYRKVNSDKDSIYTFENDNYFQFGGNQGGLLEDESFLNDPKILEIIKKYFPDSDLSEEDLQLLFSRIDYCGCDYVAACNTIFDYAKKLSVKEFEKKFGFKPYVIKTDEDGIKYKDYNYEYMNLDLFLYDAKNKRKFKSIKDVYGNEKSNPTRKDGALASDNDFKVIGMDGTEKYEAAVLTKDYLSDKGIDLKTTFVGKKDGWSGIWLDSNSKTYKKDKENLEKYGFSVDDSKYKGHVSASCEDIKRALDDNKKIVVGGDGFPLYGCKDGDNMYDDVVPGYENVGGHAMTVVNASNDKLLVSSWGEAYAIDIKDVKDITIYDYGQ